MISIERELREYVDVDRRNPFRQWLLELKDDDVRFRVRERLDRVRLGNLGDYRSVGRGVFELRLIFGPGYRIYFGFEGRQIILLLCGGDKHSQKKDIQMAQSYWKDYKG